jgi:hypothetical protein
MWLYPLEQQGSSFWLPKPGYSVDDVTRRSFQRYWRLIGLFSGLIRKEWLRLIKKQAESITESR